MNGAGNVSDVSAANGVYDHGADTASADIDSQILQALEVIHDPRSSNSIRQKASEYLEQIRSGQEAPYHGFALASAKSQPAIIRHYGLSLLEYAICYRWTDYTIEQSTALRNWVLHLSQHVIHEDPLFIRNKIAQLWVETAKRSWVLDWMNMDELLVEMWSDSVVKKELVLTILETLSDDTFGHEDTAASLRGTDLNKACVEIFTPAAVLIEHFPTRETNINVRYGEEGWLSRIGNVLDWCSNSKHDEEQRQICAVKAMSTLKSVIGWTIPRALVTSRCVERICECLAVSNLSIQLAAVDALCALYTRSRFTDDDFRDLVSPMYRVETIKLLQRLYEWSVVDSANIEEDKYLISKKFSEMMFNVGRLLEERPSMILHDTDLAGFFQLLLSIVRSQSLHVSIPALHIWVKILHSETIGSSPAVTSLIGDLLEICSQRLVRYEALPDDSSNPSIIFLNEDVDTTPERHAFLGNYKRFCKEVVEIIVQKQPIDGLYHILGQADHILDHLYDGQPAFQAHDYSKTSVPLLRLDAHFSVMEAALKGFAKWLSLQGNHETEHEQDVMTSNLENWCYRLLRLTFEDPLIKERVIQLACEFATGPLKRKSQFAFKVFEHILETSCYDEPNYNAYSDAVKELQGFCFHQLQRLAIRFPDQLITVYDELERKISDLCHTVALDEQTRMRYSSVLFIIIHRATTMDPKPREARLESFIHPIVGQWQSSELSDSLSSFEGFSELLGLGNIQKYLSARNVHRIPDWSSHPLDDEGKSIQSQMQDALERLPLRSTKTILSVSVEKMDLGSRPYSMACRLWHKNIPIILPNILQLISYAHSFYDSSNWSSLPPDMGSTVRRVLTDRFWQVGISSGSRDDFYARVGGTRVTLEGFASSIRATIRAVRETAYRLLYYMSLLGEHFYSYQELPGPLSHALFTNACALSTHQLAILVEMVRQIIENCPILSRSHFLPPILAGLFTQLDRKASAEWNKIEERNRVALEDDNLADEMRDESILRQLTFTSVMMVVNLLDPQRSNPPEPEIQLEVSSDDSTKATCSTDASMRSFILQNPEILKPVILFCTHALRMRDTRSCSFITRVLRSLVSEFIGTTTIDVDVREFISTEILKACITSLHDPYFVELQKDLAQLIATTVIMYSARTDTPRQILLSLPEMTSEKVDWAVLRLMKAQSNSRQQRALVLDLLDGLRGISISEQGKIAKADPKKVRSAMQERYMTVDVQSNEKKKGSPDLGGVADMFG